MVVEKILEGEETLPESWRCAGTTGYDALLRVQQVLTPSAGLAVLDRLWAETAPDRVSLQDVVADAKRLVVDDVQAAEVDRLMRLVRRVLVDVDHSAVRRALEALLVAMDRYRAYVVPGRGVEPEQQAVVEHKKGRQGAIALDALLQRLGINVIAMSPEAATHARGAYERYGRGVGSPGVLNFGDCLSYGVAKSAGEQLLFKGDDFAATNINVALY